LLCDADHGYGNALNVMRTVEELETAGVAALSIEDTDLPVPFGGGKARLISIEKSVARCARQLPRAGIRAGHCRRTSAPSMSSIADAIIRAKAYEATGWTRFSGRRRNRARIWT